MCPQRCLCKDPFERITWKVTFHACFSLLREALLSLCGRSCLPTRFWVGHCWKALMFLRSLCSRRCGMFISMAENQSVVDLFTLPRSAMSSASRTVASHTPSSTLPHGPSKLATSPTSTPRATNVANSGDANVLALPDASGYEATASWSTTDQLCGIGWMSFAYPGMPSFTFFRYSAVGDTSRCSLRPLACARSGRCVDRRNKAYQQTR